MCESTWPKQQTTTRARKAQQWPWGSERFLIIVKSNSCFVVNMRFRWTKISKIGQCFANPKFRLSLLHPSRSCEALHPLQKRASCLAQVVMILKMKNSMTCFQIIWCKTCIHCRIGLHVRLRSGCWCCCSIQNGFL